VRVHARGGGLRRALERDRIAGGDTAQRQTTPRQQTAATPPEAAAVSATRAATGGDDGAGGCGISEVGAAGSRAAAAASRAAQLRDAVRLQEQQTALHAEETLDRLDSRWPSKMEAVRTGPAAAGDAAGGGGRAASCSSSDVAYQLSCVDTALFVCHSWYCAAIALFVRGARRLLLLLLAAEVAAPGANARRSEAICPAASAQSAAG
jgi:hypothetical protein